MKKAIIGITTQLNYQNGDFLCRASYVRQILKAGGFPILIPPTEKPRQALDICDGFLLSGGGDIDARWYEEDPHYCNNINSLRDRFEIELVRCVFAANKPLLAICRGMQVLNVALGGTLLQDLQVQMPSDINHNMSKVSAEVVHGICLRQGSLLKTILKCGKTMVNSYHHQSVKKVADSLKISALAADGVVEAIYAPKQAFCLGVQWHPEILDNSDTKNLFNAFIKSTQNK